MLQQTQVERVIPFYEAFVARFPSFEALAGAGAGDVVTRLADAGRAALAAATRDGAGRAAALDLLAADALITLALLATAERDPAALGRAAAQLLKHAGTAIRGVPDDIPPASS